MKSKKIIPQWVKRRDYLLKINHKLLKDNKNDKEYVKGVVHKIWALNRLHIYYKREILNDKTTNIDQHLNELCYRIINLQKHYLVWVELISGLDALLDK